MLLIPRCQLHNSTMWRVQFALITGSALLTDRQKLWRDIMRQAGSLKAVRRLERPPGRMRVQPLPRAMHAAEDQQHKLA